MPAEKDRLYVALYARGSSNITMPGGEDRYHWALMIGPKVVTNDSRGMRVHAREKLSGIPPTIAWQFEEVDTTMAPTAMALVRVVVAKIKNMDRLMDIVRDVPVRPQQQGWNCVEWVKETLEDVKRDKKSVGTSNLEWEAVRDCAMRYVEMKSAQHRFDGKAKQPVPWDERKVATWDLLEDREIEP